MAAVLVALTLQASAMNAQTSLPAFPGAQGYGALARGGRGGRVIEVVNLDDSGPGSLRAAVNASGPRIVVFRVGGTIELQDDLVISGESQAYLTIAGQTAPGGGILLKNYGIWLVDTHDIVIRYLRVRMGYQGTGGDQHGILVYGSSGSASYDVVVDHLSTAWILDDNTAYGNVWDVTFQWSLFGEASSRGRDGPLGATDCSNVSSGQGGCGFMWGPADKVDRLSLHHNLIIHNYYRNPQIGGAQSQVINNVIYNYGWSAAIIGQYLEYGYVYPITTDLIGNYFRMGPDSRPGIFELYSEQTHDPGIISLHVAGNYGWNYDPDDPHAMVADIGYVRRATPLTPPVPVTVDGFEQAKDRVLQRAGASLPSRDAVDVRLVNDYHAGTSSDPTTRGINPVFPVIAGGTPPADSDHDGMPDAWEASHGLNAANPGDGPGDLDADGYTNVEEYLNELAGDGGGDSPVLLSDGFESGDLSLWSAAVTP